MNKTILFQLACFALIAFAGMQHFGVVSGLALAAAVHLLMPWQYGK